MLNAQHLLITQIHIAMIIGNFNLLWVSVIAIGVVILIGFLMVSKRKQRKPVPTLYMATHLIGTIIGALIVIIAAFKGDARLWTNIVLAVIIVILGLTMSFGKLSKSKAQTVLLCHACIGIICYGIFVYYVVV